MMEGGRRFLMGLGQRDPELDPEHAGILLPDLGRGAFGMGDAAARRHPIDGARTDRRWLVPVASTIALPIIWWHGLAMLVAAYALWRLDRREAEPGPTARAAVPSATEARRPA